MTLPLRVQFSGDKAEYARHLAKVAGLDDDVHRLFCQMMHLYGADWESRWAADSNQFQPRSPKLLPPEFESVSHESSIDSIPGL
ncbi:MAG: hypothetical protein KME45_03205 [Stenomitos rutilans HA7619-LM2]|jgi:hypothetical protein|nr:hypothetical protein [Stenomitos rutilans HA7619-LM2]MBW4469393.1 hypothetical protein [Stenomitos rutilans HA7619-LM2]